MTSGLTARTIIPPPTAETPRLRLKPKAPTTGHVDGAWWPHSRNLPIELPALLEVLSVRLGPIERVSYNVTAWGPTVRKIEVEGRIVRLGGYRSQQADTVDVIGARQRLTLLVVPPQTTAAIAHQTLMAASHRGNIGTVGELLAPGATHVEPVGSARGDPTDAAVQSWELDGGRGSIG
ncbi:DUF5994 family protein [Pseudonocardia sp. H11422]|uniref:DUF5994 family protein n=1 Tax=Pseudonocardia sp. H11422 TaxID=2835866 RepID=UPI001BDD2B37|nr:DUF5994 family protein [Pseudonocardia sp. H11422]